MAVSYLHTFKVQTSNRMAIFYNKYKYGNAVYYGRSPNHKNDSLINYFDDDNECAIKDESKALLFIHLYDPW
jgi:hypothetical protein